jgi:cellulose synthase/poly-beta-1,6-N-acetylglucosamine synthase-like glycosyltransferase
VLRALRFLCSILLAAFSARRLLLLGASSAARAAAREPEPLPSLAIAVPCRNEAGSVGRLLEALDATDYPSALLSFVLVDDGSTDGTADVLARWAAAGSSRLVVELPQSVGKVQALEAAAGAADPASDLIAVCDADLRPRPDYWRRLTRLFADDRVAAAAGFLNPTNHDASMISRYAAVETWVHQLVTSQGKDRLALNPPTHGASVYRRTALAEIGGFRAGTSGEDVTTTAALTNAGWTTRFVRDAVVDNDVVARASDYWRQHVRWTRGVFDTANSGRHQASATIPRRVEALLSSTGYLDRLAFAGALVLARRQTGARGLPALYLAVLGLEVWVAVSRGGVARKRRAAYFASLAAVFPVDVVATGVAALAQLRQRPGAWHSPR